MKILLHDDFELAYGGAVGKDHRHAHRNYQDGVHVVRDSMCTVTVVADGCGSGSHSEVGAQIGARLAAEALRREASYDERATINWRKVTLDLLASLDVLANRMGDDIRRVVEDYFLFTIVGVVLAGKTATFFALGDGVIVINGNVTPIGPFPDNRPPYLGYGLLGANYEMPLIRVIDLEELENFLVGCDGALDLVKAEASYLPGLEPQTVGPISQFWQDNRYFSGNPDLVSRRLRLAARDWPRQAPQPGLLADDTTLVVGRRIQIPI